MPFQPGNKLAAGPRKKPFKNALERAIANADGKPDALKEIAEALVAKALLGESWAIQEVANRLDGKPAQAIVGDDEADPLRLVAEIRRTIVDPRHSDGQGIPAAPKPESV